MHEEARLVAKLGAPVRRRGDLLEAGGGEVAAAERRPQSFEGFAEVAGAEVAVGDDSHGASISQGRAELAAFWKAVRASTSFSGSGDKLRLSRLDDETAFGSLRFRRATSRSAQRIHSQRCQHDTPGKNDDGNLPAVLTALYAAASKYLSERFMNTARSSLGAQPSIFSNHFRRIGSRGRRIGRVSRA
jgi:hypothetical protein